MQTVARGVVQGVVPGVVVGVGVGRPVVPHRGTGPGPHFPTETRKSGKIREFHGIQWCGLVGPVQWWVWTSGTGTVVVFVSKPVPVQWWFCQ